MARKLVIVRIPDHQTDKIDELEKSLMNLSEEYCFIIIADYTQTRIDFEYPKYSEMSESDGNLIKNFQSK